MSDAEHFYAHAHCLSNAGQSNAHTYTQCGIDSWRRFTDHRSTVARRLCATNAHLCVLAYAHAYSEFSAINNVYLTQEEGRSYAKICSASYEI